MESIRNPFPKSCTFSAETIGWRLDAVHPAELLLSERYRSSRRKREFLCGRRCAQRALRQAGFPFLPVLRNEDRSPAWPLSAIGSIAHTGTCAAAIVAKPHSSIVGLGIDIERWDRNINCGLAFRIFTERERTRWGGGQAAISREALTVFVIKESIFKCLYPLDRIYLGFADAEVLSIETDSFEVTVLKSPLHRPLRMPLRLSGVLERTDSYIVAALKVSKEQIPTVLPP